MLNVCDNLTTVLCPYCGSQDCSFWADELGYRAVRCNQCALIYVNPAPTAEVSRSAIQNGYYTAENLSVVSRPQRYKVQRYRRVFSRLFPEIREGGAISWLDVGAGYGEIMQAVSKIAPEGSNIRGLEPMQPKAAYAKAQGLDVTQEYLASHHGPVDVVSLVDVFSHVQDFSSMLRDIANVLKPGGSLFMETGNLADLSLREEFPGELGLPDHLVFAGEQHLKGFLERAGFQITHLESVRIDGLVYFMKGLVKRALGRPFVLSAPYTSKYRQLLIKATLTSPPK